jgi:hypothetical protein
VVDRVAGTPGALITGRSGIGEQDPRAGEFKGFVELDKIVGRDDGTIPRKDGEDYKRF